MYVITIYLTRVKQLLQTKGHSVKTEGGSPRFLCDPRSVKAGFALVKYVVLFSKVTLLPQFGQYLVNRQFSFKISALLAKFVNQK